MISKDSPLSQVASVVLLPVLVAVNIPAHAQSCSGVQAGNLQTQSNPPKNLYVPAGQSFHINVDAIRSALSASQATDIVNGITSWAGTNGITLTFDSAPPGPGVVTVQLGSGFASDGDGQALYGTTGAASNQITGGKITFQLGYQFPCSSGMCPSYDPTAPNADSYLTGLAAHEMGHVLGLDDTSDSARPCAATSTSVMGGQCGTNNNGDGMSKSAPTSTSPTACDKQTVASQSSSGISGSSGSVGGGSFSGGEGTGDGSADITTSTFTDDLQDPVSYDWIETTVNTSTGIDPATGAIEFATVYTKVTDLGTGAITSTVQTYVFNADGSITVTTSHTDSSGNTTTDSPVTYASGSSGSSGTENGSGSSGSGGGGSGGGIINPGIGGFGFSGTSGDGTGGDAWFCNYDWDPCWCY